MMEKRESARPTVGAVGRAMETGANHHESPDSTLKCTTPAAERQPFRISDLLLQGEQNALSMRHLRTVVGLSSREIRAMIQQERLSGTPICANNVTGYYIASDGEELARFVRSMRHRASEICAVADAVEQAEV